VIVSTGVSKAARDLLDPSIREFPYPDFGFQDELNNRGQIASIWALVFDHVGQFPKYERLRNYIRKQTAEKLQAYKERMAAEEMKEQQSGSTTGRASRRRQSIAELGGTSSANQDISIEPNFANTDTTPYESMFNDNRLGQRQNINEDGEKGGAQ